MDPWVQEAAAEIGKRAVRELEALVGVSSPSGDIHGAEECAARSLEILEDGVLVEGDDVLFTVAVLLPLAMADRDEAVEAWEYVRERTHRRGSIFAALGVALWRAVTLNYRGELAEAEGHHPALLTEWGRVTVTWWTHKIRGLHRNDFTVAAKTDRLASEQS